MLLPATLDELDRIAQLLGETQPGAAPKRTQGAPERSLRRRLPPSTVAEFVVRYNAGEDTPALSREHGISRTGHRELLLIEGVSLRRRAFTPEDADWAVRLYESGWRIKQVAGPVGQPYGSIRMVLHKHGVAMRHIGV